MAAGEPSTRLVGEAVLRGGVLIGQARSDALRRRSVLSRVERSRSPRAVIGAGSTACRATSDRRRSANGGAGVAMKLRAPASGSRPSGKLRSGGVCLSGHSPDRRDDVDRVSACLRMAPDEPDTTSSLARASMACHGRRRGSVGARSPASAVERARSDARCAIGHLRGSTCRSALRDLFGGHRVDTGGPAPMAVPATVRRSGPGSPGADWVGAGRGPIRGPGVGPQGSVGAASGHRSRLTDGCGQTLEWRPRSREARTGSLRNVRSGRRSKYPRVERRFVGVTA